MVGKKFAEDVLKYAERIEGGKDIGGTDLARILKRLRELEVEEGGPYALAIGDDVDVGMNLAVARFLQAYGVRLPKLDAYIEVALTQGVTHSSVFDQQQLEQLIKWRKAVKGRKIKDPAILGREERQVMACTYKAAQLRFSTLPQELHRTAEAIMERTIKGNVDKQMSLMALYMRQALGKKGGRFSDEQIGKLGFANILFWTAFIVYDDFWDSDEAADPKILPAANLFARHYIDFFSHLLPQSVEFRTFFHETMDLLDGANSWETAQCRALVENGHFAIPEKLPEYGDFSIKFHPAAGHILGPVSMLIELGYSVKSTEVRNLVSYFRHYLVAMQLNDDMHDWKEDIARGHISTAVWVLLQNWQAKYPSRREINLVKDMPALEELFWFKTLRPLSDAALQHVDRSRKALKALSILENPAPLERYITRNEQTAREALAEFERSKSFLLEFR
jgi:hypothetical protein